MAEFQIISAVKKGFIQTWKDRAELIKKSVPSYVLHVIAFYLISQNVILKFDEKTNHVKTELVHGIDLYAGLALLFIGIALLSYVFVYQVRLVLLGETGIPAKDEQRQSVIKTYSYAIAFFVAVLIFKEGINQGSVAIANLLKDVNNILLIAFGLVNMVISIWLMRLSVAHIPLAIDFPIKDFLRTVRGFKFSFYLFGLFVATIIPIAVVSLLSMALVVEIFGLISSEATDYAITVFAAMFYVAGFLILNNASIFALDEVMKNRAIEK